MQNQKMYDWVPFYKECAVKLLGYKNDRRNLIDKIKSIYDKTGINLPTLERDNNIVDIDPFTVLGLFNKSSMKPANRIKLISSFAKEFSIKAKVPITFDSIPVLNNQNATFYYFMEEGGRDADDIDHLWALFESALEYAESPNATTKNEVSKYFDLVVNKKGNGNSKVTMGLYWIAPEVFLNLDSRNEWYIFESGRIPKNIVNNLPSVSKKIAASTYFELIETLKAYLSNEQAKLSNFIELSFEAWRYSEEVNEQKKIQSERETKGGALADDGVEVVHYWIYSPGDNASNWEEFYDSGIMSIGWDIGNYKNYSSKNEMKQKMKELYDASKSYMNAAHATWQFANEMKQGDIVFAKKGMHQLVGRGVVTSDYLYKENQPEGFKHMRQVDWTHKGEWNHPGQAVMKTLTDITQYTEYVEKLNTLFEDEAEDDVEEIATELKPYTKDDFLSDVYVSENDYQDLTSLIRKKKNVILQGAPGVGKTWAAKRLAYSMMGVKDPSRVMMIQFHQSYSYEDFIMGFRPSEKGFQLKKGAFYTFCKEAEVDSDNDYFFIIDEINRGNLSRIFGELFMLIEADKRGNELLLLYSEEKFSVPKNIHIIGTMNTADRSLAMLDYALRRRFAFYSLKPAFQSEGFRMYRKGLNNPKLDKLVSCVEKLNGMIAKDDSLGDGFCIGHSYFCNLTAVDAQVLSGIVEYELIPLLREYWFDEPDRIREWTDELRSSIR
jgi:5-methylcytosine-specific restriction protein B